MKKLSETYFKNTSAVNPVKSPSPDRKPHNVTQQAKSPKAIATSHYKHSTSESRTPTKSWQTPKNGENYEKRVSTKH